MSPTASQVHDLCVDLKFIGKISEDEKVHVGSKSLQPATTLLTRILRMISWEDNSVTIKYVIDKTGRAIEFCDQLLNELHDHDKRDMFRMVREDLEGCVAPDRGLDALHNTYLKKHAPASELEVIVRNIKMKLVKYNAALPPVRPTQSPMVYGAPPGTSPMTIPTRGPFDSNPSPMALSSSAPNE
jgi:hypothetical protein